MSVYERLSALSLSLPEVAPPVAAFVPFVRTGNLVYLSGHIAKKDGKPWVGQLRLNVTTEEGKAAARAVAIDLMGTLHAGVGDLNRIQRIVKLLVLVNSAPTFIEQHLVANGASELLGQVLVARPKVPPFVTRRSALKAQECSARALIPKSQCTRPHSRILT